MRRGLLITALLLGGCSSGCGARQEVATGSEYAAILRSCDEREEEIVREAETREEAEEKLDVAMAYCDERRRQFRAQQLDALEEE